MLVVYKLFSSSFVLVILVSVQCSLTHVDVGTDTTTLAVEPMSTAICSVCACADNVVNCANLNISTPFQKSDWEGLQDFKPLTVNLSFNPISSITSFGNLPIQVLDLSNCDITNIEDGSFMYLQDLTVLDLTKNKMSISSLSKKVFCGPLTLPSPTAVPGLANFKKIQSLSLAYNDLHSLPKDIFLFMPTLTKLDLSRNPLAYIDQVTMGAISDLKNLRELRLSGCALETLPKGLLRRLKDLQRLDLSDNRFTTVPEALQEARSLVYLNLDKNSIQSLEPSALTNLTLLQELYMSRLGRLQNITEGALGGLFNLVVLQLSNNPRLTNLDPDFLVLKNEDGEKFWPTLKQLYLNNNNLSGIDSGILDSWKDLETGDFSGNPYSCDCSNQWMVDVLVPLLNTCLANATVQNMICKKPSELRGLSFSQLFESSKTLVCPEPLKITEVPTGNMVILLGIMIGIVVTFPVVLIVVLLWRRGIFSRLRSHKHYPRGYEEKTEDL